MIFSLRISPHHQNTGGFFVAVFEKTGVLPWQQDKNKNTTMSDVAKVETLLCTPNLTNHFLWII